MNTEYLPARKQTTGTLDPNGQLNFKRESLSGEHQ